MTVPVIAAVAISDTGAASASSINMTAPTGIVVGSFLLMMVMTEDSSDTDAILLPAGWTEIQRAGNSGAACHCKAMYRIADGTEADPVVVSFGATAGSDRAIGFYCRVTGVDTADPINVTGAASTPGPTPSSLTAVTTDEDDVLVIGCWSMDGGDGLPFTLSGTGWPTSPDQEHTDENSAGSCCGGYVSKEVDTATSNALTITAATSDTIAGFLFGLNAAAAATPGSYREGDYADRATVYPTPVVNDYFATRDSPVDYLYDGAAWQPVTLQAGEVEPPDASGDWTGWVNQSTTTEVFTAGIGLYSGFSGGPTSTAFRYVDWSTAGATREAILGIRPVGVGAAAQEIFLGIGVQTAAGGAGAVQKITTLSAANSYSGAWTWDTTGPDRAVVIGIAMQDTNQSGGRGAVAILYNGVPVGTKVGYTYVESGSYPWNMIQAELWVLTEAELAAGSNTLTLSNIGANSLIFVAECINIDNTTLGAVVSGFNSSAPDVGSLTATVVGTAAGDVDMSYSFATNGRCALYAVALDDTAGDVLVLDTVALFNTSVATPTETDQTEVATSTRAGPLRGSMSQRAVASGAGSGVLMAAGVSINNRLGAFVVTKWSAPSTFSATALSVLFETYQGVWKQGAYFMRVVDDSTNIGFYVGPTSTGPWVHLFTEPIATFLVGRPDRMGLFGFNETVLEVEAWVVHRFTS